MLRRYRVRIDGETLDEICSREYGTSATLRDVYEANRSVQFKGGFVHLSSLGLRLPAGVEIVLPEVAEKGEPIETIQLWD